MSKKIPAIGQVIRSKEFAFGYFAKERFHNERTNCIYVDGVTTSHVFEAPYSDAEIVDYVKKFNKLPAGNKTIDFGCPDAKRALAEYVVEQVTLDEDQDGIIHYEDPGVTVVARELNPDGTYNDEGELISFRYNHGFTGTIQNITVLRTMKVLFV